MKIEAQLGYKGIVICLEEDCPFSQTCANHCSGNLQRSLKGFSPEIDFACGSIYCKTIEQNPEYQENRTIPINFYRLEIGVFQFENEEKKMDVGLDVFP